MSFLFTRGQHGDQPVRERGECWKERKEVYEGELGKRGGRVKRSPMPVGSGQEVEDNGEKKMNKEIPFCKMAIYPAHILRLQNF